MTATDRSAGPGASAAVTLRLRASTRRTPHADRQHRSASRRRVGQRIDVAMRRELMRAVSSGSAVRESDAAAACQHAGDHEPVIPLAIELLHDSPARVRRPDDERVSRLAASLQKHGQASVIIVRKTSGGYEIIDGHDVVAAARQLCLQTIDAIVKDRTDNAAWRDAIILNRNQWKLTDYEYAQLLRDAQVRQIATSDQELAELFGWSVNAVATRLALLTLPPQVRKELDARPGRISAKVARAVAMQFPDEAARQRHLMTMLTTLGRKKLTAAFLKQWLAQDVADAPAMQKAAAGSPDMVTIPGAEHYVGRINRAAREVIFTVLDPRVDLDRVLHLMLRAMRNFDKHSGDVLLDQALFLLSRHSDTVAGVAVESLARCGLLRASHQQYG